MTKLIFTLGLFMIFSGTQTADALELEEGHLFSRCAPMDLVVKIFHYKLPWEDPKSPGFDKSEREVQLVLTNASMADAAESRLRAARLFEKNASQYLHVKMHRHSVAFTYTIGLHRWIEDSGFGRSGTLPVWTVSRLGTGADKSGELAFEDLSEQVDSFVAAYLRVNEGHCSKE